MRDLRSLQGLVDGIASRTKDLSPNFPSLNTYNRQLREATRQLALAGQYSIDEGKAIKAVVEATKNQEEAQKRINNLLREANGLRAAEVERRATNTYRTTQNRKSFLAEQASDVEKLQAALSGMQSSGPNPFGIGPDQRQEELLNKYTADMEKLQQVLGSMEGRAYNPFGISAQQIEIADHNTKKWKADLEEVNKQLQEAGLLAEKIRGVEGTASAAARQRLELQSTARRTAATDPIARLAAGVVTRPVANYNPSNVQLGPAGNAEAVRLAAGNAMRRNSEAEIAFASEIARIKRDFDIKNYNLQIDLLQRELVAEIDNIETIAAARKKADDAALADFDKRLAARTEAKADVASKRKAFNQKTESLALGVGFPLLFGGGAGSVLGAAAGSFVGSGFGGQILGGAVGQIIDEFIKSTQDLGIALNEPTKAFDALKERSLLTTKALEKLGDRLQEAGFGASASALAQREFASAVGRDGAQNLRELGDAADRSSRAFAEAVARFQGKVAGPLSRIQGFLATGGEISNAQAQGFDVNQQLAKAGRGNTVQAKALQNLLMPGAGAGKSKEQFLNDLQAAVKAAEKQLPPLKIKLSPEQIREELKNTLSKQLEALDTSRGLVQAVRERTRAQQDLDQQRADMVLQQERAIGDLRRQIEDRIIEMRLNNLQRENELLSVQGEIRMQQLRNSNIGLRSGFSNDRASSAANAVADYLESELQTANDAARIKRDTALEVKRIDIETERFKIQTAIQISRLNQDTAKQVASIQRGVLRQNQDYDVNRFKLEQSLAKLRLQGLAAEFALLAQQGQAAQRPDIAGSASKALSFTQAGIDQIDKLKGPSPLRFNRSGIGSVGASTSGIDAQSFQAKQLLGDITAAKQTLLDLGRAGNYSELKAKLDASLIKPLTDAANEAQLLFIELSGQKLGTASSGFAKANSELDDLISQLQNLKNSDALKGQPGIQKLVQSYIDVLPGLDATNRTLSTQKNILTDLNDKQIQLTDQLLALKSPYGELTQVQQVRNDLLRQGIPLENDYSQQLLSQAASVDALQEQIRLAGHLQDLYRGVGQAMGDGVTNGVSQLVAGTQTVQQLFANFLNAINEMLMAKAAEMIATYIAIGIARMFATGGGMGLSGAVSKASKLNSSIGFGAGSVKRYANGGTFANSIVSSPTLFKYAKGGALATGVMGEAGPEAVMPLTRGPNGKLGVSGYGGGGNVSVVVNVDASGSSVQGDDSRANELGRLVSVAVQQELIKQKRPGGVLA